MRREIWIGELVINDQTRVKIARKHGVDFVNLKAHLICVPGLFAELNDIFEPNAVIIIGEFLWYDFA